MEYEKGQVVAKPVEPGRPKGFGIRHFQSILLFFGLAFAMALRTNLSVGIVAMTDNSTNPDFEDYDWDEASKGLVLSSFFWGYIVMQVPGGMLAHLFGAKYVLLSSLVGASIFTLIIPPLAPLGWGYVCATRVVNGLFQGLLYPSIYTLMAQWVHPSERALSTIIVAGNTFGIFFMMIISGEIAASPLGWPGIFYLSGGLGIIWAIFWIIFGSDSPAKHKSISEMERQFIQNSVGTTSKEALPVPWMQIIRSPPFLALLTVHCGQNWGYYTLITETPTYMKHILNFNLQSSAILASLPYLVMVIVCFLISPLSDFLINNQYLTREMSRKMFNTFGHWMPMVCLILLGIYGQDGQEIAVALLILAVGFNAGCHSGFLLNHMDLSPNFSGTLYGITNCISNIFSLLAPMFVGFVINPDPYDAGLWQIVFFVAAGIYFIGNFVFLIFGKSTIQYWNVGRQ